MKKMNYRIPLQTDGQNKTWKELEITAERNIRRNGRFSLSTWSLPLIHHIQRHGKLDPAIETVAKSLKDEISSHFSRRWIDSLSLIINNFEIIIHKEGNRFFANNEATTLSNLSMNLSRFLYRVSNELSRRETAKLYYEVISTPAEIEYVLLNRVPYYFYEDGRKQDVRLNVRRIGEEKAAIELMEGEWGPISFKDLKTYLSHYLFGTKRGNWKYLSPEVLYAKITGKKQSVSDREVMRAFLIQNRTMKLVTDRADTLLQQTLSKFSKNLIHWMDDGMLRIFVRGKENDWLFRYDTKSSRQMGSTQLVQTCYIDSNYLPRSVCIDNAQNNSSKADQLVTRLLVAMNDATSKRMVSTMTNIRKTKNRIRDEYYGKPLPSWALEVFETGSDEGLIKSLSGIEEEE